MNEPTLDVDARRRFEAGWAEGRPGPIEAVLPAADHPEYPATLEELVALEIEFARKRFGRFSDPAVPHPDVVEAYLARFPALRNPRVVGRLARHEYDVRHRYGDRPAAAGFHTRFPDEFAADRAEQAALGAAAVPGRRDAARELLFGLLAFQNDFIGRVDLLSAFNAWVADRSRPLGQILRERGAIDTGRHALLEALVGEHLKRHGDDPDQSLAALSSLGPARSDLERVADPDVQASLALAAIPS